MLKTYIIHQDNIERGKKKQKWGIFYFMYDNTIFNEKNDS